MQLSLKFVTGLLLASSAAFAENANEISLERRNSFISSNNELNVNLFSKHMVQIDHKYKTALNNYKRNIGKDHPLLRLLLGQKRGGPASLDLTDVQNEQLWAGEVTFGGQTFGIDFDTGSADTLVNPSAYNPKKSKSAKNTHESFQASYGDGTTAKGAIYTDSFEIAGLKAKNVAIGHSTTKFIDDQDPSEGISGMAFPSIQTFPKQYKPFFESLKDQKAVSQGVFQFTLKSGKGSTLTLGGVDSSKYTGDVAYTDVDPSQGFWLTDAKINGKGIKAIIDSGSTIISGPTDQVRSVVQGLKGMTPFNQGGTIMYTYDCSQTPSITINVAGKDFKLGKAQTRYGTVQGGKCVLPIAGQDGMPMDAWIVGDTFFQATSIIFDTDKNRMGFAKQA
ncbi:cathepsin D [Malassezia japonica]|uniref:Cathepsin D n=1 Tax=Malassezia japonica TaxID=223818 RepID=A0AAF0JEX0_9BASI|nr:cathepsin D [Malassezia japonica]WFD38371.1 cathepsin D [Malassezia japonica]